MGRLCMRIMAIGPVFNEGKKAVETIKRFPKGLVDEVVVVDDCSTDDSPTIIQQAGVTVLKTQTRSGPGSAIRVGIDYGLARGADIFVIFAMNGKDNPEEVPRLLAPIQANEADFVQGSRYLTGGGHRDMPFHRIWGIWLFSFLFSRFLGKRILDATNGFRAFRSGLLKDERINLKQDWLEGDPLETYLFAQAIRCGYRVLEVPVTKTYPKSKKNYSKMKPLLDWWNYFKPVPFLCLGIKK